MAQLQRLVIVPTQVTEQQIWLTVEQQHYLNRVLRFRQGDRFIALDGRGQAWLAQLMNATEAEIIEAVEAQTELPIMVNLLLAMPKNGMDEVIRQVTELGVAQIVPVISDRTILKPNPQKQERWQRIAQEAAEQSERLIVPQVHIAQTWREALQTWNDSTSVCFLAEARGEHPHLLNQLGQLHQKWGDELTSQLHSMTVAIGPEGGWTTTEIEAAIAVGYQPISLGSRILRAVTAPIVAMSLIVSVVETVLNQRPTEQTMADTNMADTNMADNAEDV